MHIFQIHFVADESLVISEGSAEGMRHTSLSYVPGSMLLGAMATLWKKNKRVQFGDNNPEFEALFLQGAVSWGHAVPTCDLRPCLPIPASWEYVKQNGTLPTFGTKTPRSSRISNLLQKPRNDDSEDSQKQEKRKRHPQGFVDALSFCKPNVQIERNTHVAMDATSRTAAEGKLFAYQTIASGTTFCSTVLCHDDWGGSVGALLQEGSTIYVGHSRSAGYGALRIAKVTALQGSQAENTHTMKKGSHTLLLNSHYLMQQSWKNPLLTLQSELEAYVGKLEWEDNRVFCTPVRLEGFNGLWRLPRPTRHGLCAGSVFRFSCEKDGVVPFALGAWQQEGYGRILIDSPLVATQNISPKPTFVENAGVLSSSQDMAMIKNICPFLPAWRRRTLDRIAEEQAINCVWAQLDEWKKFFTNLKDSKPSQSQRGNIRAMLCTQSQKHWSALFEAMLKKTPGKDWSGVATFSPFSYQREMLHEIMLDFFDASKMDELFKDSFASQTGKPLAVGGALSTEENAYFIAARHKRFLLELLRRWEKEFRQKEEAHDEVFMHKAQKETV